MSIDRRAFVLTAGTAATCAATSGTLLARPGLIVPERPDVDLERVAIHGWLAAVTAGVASNYLFEMIKNWGLVPGSTAATAVAPEHQQEQRKLHNEGYKTKKMYSGAMSGGDLELSEAISDDDFMALGTSGKSGHHHSVCNSRFSKQSVAAMRLTSGVLGRHMSAEAVRACTVPIHSTENDRVHRNGDLTSASYMSPSGGSISWKGTDLATDRPRFVTEIRSPQYTGAVRIARKPEGGWVYDV
jgi:hypothetical protein